MHYVAKTPIRYVEDNRQKHIAPGRRVPDTLVDDSLIDSGAVEAAGYDAPDEPGRSPHKMTRAELDVVVTDEGVQLNGATTNAQIADAIVTHRIAQQQ